MIAAGQTGSPAKAGASGGCAPRPEAPAFAGETEVGGFLSAFGPAAVSLYGLAAKLLGWKPGTFWAATPAELVAALAPPGSPPALARADLERMMEQENG